MFSENVSYRVEGIIDWERALWEDLEIETAMCYKFYGQTFFIGSLKAIGGKIGIK